TGGTICGTAKYLKEKNPNIKIFGIDTYGSVFKKYKETGIFDKNEIYPYVTEGIGEDFLPENVNFDLIDLFEKVTDKDAALMTREIAKQEGIFAGNSAGSAMAGLMQLANQFKEGDVVVVIFHDHGTRYLGKMFNDDWMREKGYFDKKGLLAKDLVTSQKGEVASLESTATIEDALKLMEKMSYSQIPVTTAKRMVGSLNETDIYRAIVANPEVKSKAIDTIMKPAFPFVDISTPIDALSQMLSAEHDAVLVRDFKIDKTYIITRSDVLNALTR
ncbi:MAG TPA: pyridoxal-phosphate dependent enzyme, partial [Bacteroidia bacterium]|nr:pyridoxal-phosphate dependent enzyme [Bacteroidia bacterium]